jgi:beta-galactosidase
VPLDDGDVAHVAFEIVDSDGTVVPRADNLATFTATGGISPVVDIADLGDLEPYRSDRRHAFNGRGPAIVAARQPGLLRLTASGEGLGPGSVTVRVVRGAAPEAVPAAGRK